MNYQKKTAQGLKNTGVLHWNTKHGHAPRAGLSSLYTTLQHIKRRCDNKNSKEYRFYGAIGRKLCSGWRGSDGVSKFSKQVGPRPSKNHPIDRIDNDGHYSCGECDECAKNGWKMNCCWATKQRQANHRKSTRRVTFNGEKMSLADAARKTGINQYAILGRLRLGWDEFRALTTPLKK